VCAACRTGKAPLVAARRVACGPESPHPQASPRGESWRSTAALPRKADTGFVLKTEAGPAPSTRRDLPAAISRSAANLSCACPRARRSFCIVDRSRRTGRDGQRHVHTCRTVRCVPTTGHHRAPPFNRDARRFTATLSLSRPVSAAVPRDAAAAPNPFACAAVAEPQAHSANRQRRPKSNVPVTTCATPAKVEHPTPEGKRPRNRPWWQV